jgi:hypothetical protein
MRPKKRKGDGEQKRMIRRRIKIKEEFTIKTTPPFLPVA